MKHMKCKFIRLCTAMAEPLPASGWGEVPYGIRAMIIRLDTHPRLGSAHPDEGMTITSEVQCIDFENRMLRTRNSIYYWEE